MGTIEHVLSREKREKKGSEVDESLRRVRTKVTEERLKS